MKKKALVPAKKNVYEAERIQAIKDRKTPRKHIDTLNGFDYVKIGYMRRQLEEAYPGSWDVETEELIGAVNSLEALSKLKEVVVKVTLTIYDNDRREIRRVSAYGGGTVRFNRTTKDPVGLADNYKTAQADGLKKAASLMGFCSDVYEPVVEQREDEDKAEAKVFNTANLEPNKPISPQLSEAFVAKVTKAGLQRHVGEILEGLGIKNLKEVTNEKFVTLNEITFGS